MERGGEGSEKGGGKAGRLAHGGGTDSQLLHSLSTSQRPLRVSGSQLAGRTGGSGANLEAERASDRKTLS